MKEIYCRNCANLGQVYSGLGTHSAVCKLAGELYFDPVKGKTITIASANKGDCENVYGTDICKPERLGIVGIIGRWMGLL